MSMDTTVQKTDTKTNYKNCLDRNELLTATYSLDKAANAILELIADNDLPRNDERIHDLTVALQYVFNASDILS